MIIKDYNMEEKSKDIQYLKELKNNNPEKSKEIEEEIKKIKSGIKAENKKETHYKCEICDINIDNSVLFWCRKNKIKFNNKILCREHQPK